MAREMLYILSFLHQTTTKEHQQAEGLRLYILSFLHQTTTYLATINFKYSCISYHFYIKPQRCLDFSKGFRSCISYHFYIKPQQ